jgi:hypothetical protein
MADYCISKAQEMLAYRKHKWPKRQQQQIAKQMYCAKAVRNNIYVGNT